MLLTIVHALQDLFYNWKFVPFDHLHSSPPPAPASGDHQCVPCICEFVIFKISRINEIIRYLSVFVWLISLSLVPSGSIYIVANGRISFFFFYGCVVFYCVYIYMCHIFFIDSPVHGHRFFHTVAVVSSAAANVPVQLSFCCYCFVSF